MRRAQSSWRTRCSSSPPSPRSAASQCGEWWEIAFAGTLACPGAQHALDAPSAAFARAKHILSTRRGLCRAPSRHLVVGSAKHAQLAGALERVVLPHVRHHHVPKSRAPRNLATPRPRQRPKCESESERAAEPAKASQDQQPPRVDGNPRRAGKGADAGCVNDSGASFVRDVINSSGRFSTFESLVQRYCQTGTAYLAMPTGCICACT